MGRKYQTDPTLCLISAGLGFGLLYYSDLPAEHIKEMI